jgi:hypothetical protein
MRGLVSGSASLAACAFSGSETAVCQLVSVNAERLSRVASLRKITLIQK